MDPIYDGTFHQCERLGILPMAWSPLAQGRLFDPKKEAAQRLKGCADVTGGSADSVLWAAIPGSFVYADGVEPTAQSRLEPSRQCQQNR